MRWRWITSQTYISVNAMMPTNSVNSISPFELDVAVGAEHARLLVEAAPQLDAEVHERDLQHGEQGEHRRGACPAAVGPAEAACSEYMFLDDSACNLASLNLLKFSPNGTFDVEAYRHSVDVLITAQEILSITPATRRK